MQTTWIRYHAICPIPTAASVKCPSAILCLPRRKYSSAGFVRKMEDTGLTETLRTYLVSVRLQKRSNSERDLPSLYDFRFQFIFDWSPNHAQLQKSSMMPIESMRQLRSESLHDTDVDVGTPTCARQRNTLCDPKSQATKNGFCNGA